MGKSKKPKSKKHSRAKEQWYQLVAMFDDKDLTATAIKGAFFRGAIDKTMIVEVQKDFPEAQYGSLASWLETNGIEAMVVKEGVRFLKLQPATEDQEAVLEAHRREEMKREAAPDKPPAPKGPPEPEHIPEEFEGRV